LDPREALSLHATAEEQNEERMRHALQEIPDKVLTEWGAPPPTNGDEIKTNITEKKEETSEPSSKKQKVQEDDEAPEPQLRKKPGYVPKFLPAFPQSFQTARVTIDPSLLEAPPKMTAAASADFSGVRSSLVDLERKRHEYWGSGWDAIKVPPGKATTPDDNKQQPAAVVPLSRASNARVSRILEGSMDVAT
jgi:hypothetical protein